MKLVIGLGNPGKVYEQTRHNVGFMAIDNYVVKNNLIEKEKFGGKYYEQIKDGEKFIFLKPQKYMNLSGGVVRQFINFFKIEINDILVISDDLDLPVGKMKLKLAGSCGGHNGLRDIENQIKTKEYKRIKIGISNDKSKETKDYVLGKFSKSELEIINLNIVKIEEIINLFGILKFDNIMNRYN